MRLRVVLLLLMGSACSDTMEAEVRDLGLLLGSGGYRVTERFTRGNQRTAIAHNGERTLRISAIAVDSAEAGVRHVREQEVVFHSIFEPNLPPYPEFLTKETGCPERFKPKVRTFTHGTFNLAYASERLGYGVCNDDLAHYRAGIGHLLCPSHNRVFTVEIFVPASGGTHDIEAVFASLSCRPI